MKKIFIYYSLTGNGNIIAKQLKENGYDIRKIEAKNKMPNSFILRIITGGFKAMINYKEKLIDFNNDISKYDEVVFGSPIWNDRLSTPLRTTLERVDTSNKKKTFILYSGSGKASKAEAFIKENYPNAIIINLKEPQKNKNELEKIKNL